MRCDSMPNTLDRLTGKLQAGIGDGQPHGRAGLYPSGSTSATSVWAFQRHGKKERRREAGSRRMVTL